MNNEERRGKQVATSGEGHGKVNVLSKTAENIVTLTRQSRLRWLGHGIKRDLTVAIRRVLNVQKTGVFERAR